MKKNVLGVMLALSLLLPINIQAESTCNYNEQAELNNIAANVKANYESTQVYAGKAANSDDLSEEVDLYNWALKINILNVTEDIFIKVKDKNTGEEKLYSPKEAIDGIISFTHEDISQTDNLTIEIYANKYDCAGDLLQKIELLIPQYNPYSDYGICDTYTDYYYCQQFITGENIPEEDFWLKVEEMQEQEEKEQQQEEQGFFVKIKNFYKENKVTINILGSIVVVGGVVTTVILIKKRRSRVL